MGTGSLAQAANTATIASDDRRWDIFILPNFVRIRFHQNKLLRM
jgi:hypothetical protein